MCSDVSQNDSADFAYEFIFSESSYENPGVFFSVKQEMGKKGGSYHVFRYSLGKAFDPVNSSKCVFFSMQSRSQLEVENAPVNFMEEGVYS